jgi:putative Mg2+ transporter-C (MgtC) family protein
MGLGDFAVRVGAALLFGAVMGLERQLHHRLAGLRTNSLVAMGAAAFVALSGMVPGDSPTRIAAQVVSGIGFLGAGVIFKEGFNVHGLTTAATLWCAAAAGSLAGLGFVAAGSVVTAMVLATNVLLRPLSHMVDRVPSKSEMEVSYRIKAVCGESVEEEIRALLFATAAQDSVAVRGIHSEHVGQSKTVRIEATFVIHGRSNEVIEQVTGRISRHPEVATVSWEVAGEVHLG